MQQVKRGRQTGATQWARIIVMLASAAELVNVVLDARQGKARLTLLADAIVLVFIVAMAAMGLGLLELNERFASLIALLGEDVLLRGKEERS